MRGAIFIISDLCSRTGSGDNNGPLVFLSLIHRSNKFFLACSREHYERNASDCFNDSFHFLFLLPFYIFKIIQTITKISTQCRNIYIQDGRAEWRTHRNLIDCLHQRSLILMLFFHKYNVLVIINKIHHVVIAFVQLEGIILRHFILHQFPDRLVSKRASSRGSDNLFYIIP